MYAIVVSRLNYHNVFKVESEIVLVDTSYYLTQVGEVLDGVFDKYLGEGARVNLVINNGIAEGVRTKVLEDGSVLIATYTNKGMENIK